MSEVLNFAAEQTNPANTIMDVGKLKEVLEEAVKSSYVTDGLHRADVHQVVAALLMPISQQLERIGERLTSLETNLQGLFTKAAEQLQAAPADGATTGKRGRPKKETPPPAPDPQNQAPPNVPPVEQPPVSEPMVNLEAGAEGAKPTSPEEAIRKFMEIKQSCDWGDLVSYLESLNFLGTRPKNAFDFYTQFTTYLKSKGYVVDAQTVSLPKK